MSLRAEFLSSTAHFILVQMDDNITGVAHVPSMPMAEIKMKLVREFNKVWNMVLQSNAMFKNKYNMDARL